MKKDATPGPLARTSIVVGLAAAALAGACHHEWDALVPRADDATSGGTGATTTTTTTTTPGAGGAGQGGAASGGSGGATTTSTTSTKDAGAGGAGGATASGGAGPDGGALGQGECPKGLAGPALVRVAVAGGAYCVDATEVTRTQYAAWLATSPPTGAQPPWCAWNTSFVPKAYWPPDAAVDDVPVVDVDWCDARAYCEAAGKHLCGRIGGGTPDYAAFFDAASSEWQRACAGSPGHAYPYGDAYDPKRCNGADQGVGVAVASTGTCEGAPAGVFDLSGNVWEWEASCDGWSGPGDRCRVRGGSFSDSAIALACAVDATSTRAGFGLNTGFRCCADAAP